MDDWIFEGGKPTMCLDKYLRSVSIKCMVQKIQIRQLMATSLIGMDNNAAGGVTNWQSFSLVPSLTWALTSYKFIVLTVVSESDKHGLPWAKCKRSGLTLSRQKYNLKRYMYPYVHSNTIHNS